MVSPAVAEPIFWLATRPKIEKRAPKPQKGAIFGMAYTYRTRGPKTP